MADEVEAIPKKRGLGPSIIGLVALLTLLMVIMFGANVGVSLYIVNRQANQFHSLHMHTERQWCALFVTLTAGKPITPKNPALAPAQTRQLASYNALVKLSNAFGCDK